MVRWSDYTPIMRLFLLLAILFGFGCDRSTTSIAEPAAEPEQEIRFPVDANAARYMYFDQDGRPVVIADRNEIPPHLSDLSAVLLGERTQAPAGLLYHWQSTDDDGRVGTARLAARDTLSVNSIAAWAASDVALGIWETVTSRSPEEAAEVNIATPASPARVPQPPSSDPAEPPAQTIEFVNLDRGAQKSRRDTSAKHRPEVVAPHGWRDVTIYYTDTCGWCRRAMRWMDTHSVPYRKRNVGTDPPAARKWQAALRSAGRRGGGVPTFVIEGQVMQGWDKDRFIKLAKR